MSSTVLCYGLVWIYSQSTINTENFALGEATSSHFAAKDGHTIHLLKVSDSSFSDLYDGWSKANSVSTLLVLGNSQTHSINQYKNGDFTYVKGLSDRDELGYVIAHSVPNASIQDFLLSTSYLTNKLKIDKILIPTFFDDYREDGIRALFYPKLVSEKHLLDTSLNEINTIVNSELQLFWLESTLDDEKKYINTQTITEKILDSTFVSHSSVWAARPKMRGQLFINLYQTRNKIFNISAQTIRHKIPSRYDKNMDCLKAILTLAETNKIAVYLYIPPIRNDVQIPYDLNDYQSFKVEIEALCNTYSNCYFKNLENLVPAEYFGMKKSTSGSSELEYDFMHFQYKGHQLLDSALSTFLTRNK